jgi:hypothetical protein
MCRILDSAGLVQHTDEDVERTPKTRVQAMMAVVLVSPLPALVAARRILIPPSPPQGTLADLGYTMCLCAIALAKSGKGSRFISKFFGAHDDGAGGGGRTRPPVGLDKPDPAF